MVTSKLMASKSTSRNSDLRRKTSFPSTSLKAPPGFYNQPYTIGAAPAIAITDQEYNSNSDSNSMTRDGFLRNVYGGDKQPATETTLLNAEITLLDAAGAIAPIEDAVDDLWREIVEGKREQPTAECKEKEKAVVDEMMTLEDFLVKAGEVEEVKIETGTGTERVSGGMFSFDSPYSGTSNSQQSAEGVAGFGNGMEGSLAAGRGKRKVIMEPLDKASLQRQRRMIKNRESAARSRERKQAYQVELESMAMRLEEENEQLLREKAQRTRKRFKQFMEKVIPITEKRRPPLALRRVGSAQW